ncbi:MAG: RdgB/HAM1 family non-canonical purine NTP pyrophosphatase [Actinomycetota bacterium]
MSAPGPVPECFVLATANPDKAAEIAEILAAAGVGITLTPRPTDVPDVVEDAATLEDNARLKAVALVAATGSPTIADDTGLEVDALGGAPGVHSARFAGPDATYADNCAHLLARMTEVTTGDRRARFVTVAIARWPDGRELVAYGAVEGHITTEARGDGGFGYDAVFAPAEGSGVTFAELTAPEKHAISHRGRAFRTLARQFAELPDSDGADEGA